MTLTGKLEGRTILLDEEIPSLQGQRVSVVVTSVPDHELELSAKEQRDLWDEWEKRGPQGPIEDDGEADFP